MSNKVHVLECLKKKYIKAEAGILDVAMEMGEYIQTVQGIDDIKNEFSGIESVLFEQWDRHNKRGNSALIIYTFEVDALCDVLPKDGTLIVCTLTELSASLHAMYKKPTKDTKHKVDSLIRKIKDSIEINLEDYVDLERVRRLHMTLYMCLMMLDLSLKQLNSAARWGIKVFIDLDQFHQDIIQLLDKAEKKINYLSQLSIQRKGSGVKKNIQEYFNERFLAQLQRNSRDKRQFIAIENDMRDIIYHLNQVINYRSEQEDIASKVKKMKALLAALLQNDNRVVGRYYFLEFMDAHREAFNELWADLTCVEKKALEEQIIQLRMPSVTSKLLKGMSWATAWITPVYRSVAPGFFQELTNKINTLDRLSKKELKRLITIQLSHLEGRKRQSEAAMGQSLENLSKGAPDLKEKIVHESTEGLWRLVQANSAAREALGEYCRIASSLEGDLFYHQVIKAYQGYCSRIIEIHDGFWVKLSNLFSKISLLFKTDTASMVDKAREIIIDLEALERQFKIKRTSGLNALDNHQGISNAMKEQLQHRIKNNVLEVDMRQPTFYLGKEHLDCIIKNINTLFDRGLNKDTQESFHSSLRVVMMGRA